MENIQLTTETPIENKYGISEIFKVIDAAGTGAAAFDNVLKDDRKISGWDEYTALGFAMLPLSRIDWALFAMQAGKDFTAEEKKEAFAYFKEVYSMPNFKSFEEMFEEAVALGFEAEAFFQNSRKRMIKISAFFKKEDAEEGEETPQETPHL